MTQHIPPINSKLTTYESDVLLLVSQGWTNQEVAYKLHRTPQSICMTIRRLRYKLDLHRDLRHEILAEQYKQLNVYKYWAGQ